MAIVIFFGNCEMFFNRGGKREKREGKREVKPKK